MHVIVTSLSYSHIILQVVTKMAAQPSNRSRSYEDFSEEFQLLIRHHNIANEISNQQLHSTDHPRYTVDELKAVQMSNYQDAFISVMVKWEAFVPDLLQEAFDKGIKQICEEGYPSLSTNDQRSFLRGKASDYYDSEKAKKDDERQKKMSIRGGTTLLAADGPEQKPYVWKTSLEDYTEFSLRYCTPMFQGIAGIDAKMRALFATKTVSQVMTRNPIRFHCILDGPMPSKLPVIEIANPKALVDMTRLLYGIRYILAHGKSEGTLTITERGGALHEFPELEAFRGELGENTSTELIDAFYHLFQRAQEKQNGSIHFKMSNADVVNVQRFIFTIASRFQNAMQGIFYEYFGVMIWDKVEEPSFIC